MDAAQALLLGIVEGVTEFLPISSTAHLMLTRRLLGLPDTSFQKTFEIAIQFGAILAVVVLYWHRLLVEWRVLLRVLIAFVPTGLLGFTLYRIIKDVLQESHSIALASLAIGGVVLIAFDLLHREPANAVKSPEGIAYWKCVLIGLAQALAMIPGVSRAAATIIGGLSLGLSRKTAVEFSFLLAVPTMTAATAYDVWKTRDALSLENVNLLLIGLVTSFVVALLTVQLFLRFLRTHTFLGFGIYRIVAAAVLWIVLVNY
jgi:undecaprenyl-diphosphatase